jgi:tungstate transport system ATP-binding protein
MSEDTTHIAFRNIHKRFGRRPVLNGASLELQGGLCSLLTGPNGSGKTTLLLICAGLERPDQAELNLGVDMRSWKCSRRSLLEKTVYLHQHPYMFDGSVVKNLAYGLPKNISRKERNRRIDRGLDWAGLAPIAHTHAKSLSGGEKQRVALARAWLRNPAVLLLDEPTANMDQIARQRSFELIQRLKSEGIALLIASHDPLHFLAEADNCLALKDGVIHEEKPSACPIENITPLHPSQKVIYGTP